VYLGEEEILSNPPQLQNWRLLILSDQRKCKFSAISCNTLPLLLLLAFLCN